MKIRLFKQALKIPYLCKNSEARNCIIDELSGTSRKHQSCILSTFFHPMLLSCSFSDPNFFDISSGSWNVIHNLYGVGIFDIAIDLVLPTFKLKRLPLIENNKVNNFIFSCWIFIHSCNDCYIVLLITYFIEAITL